ncbi:MAG: ABC-2 type transport system permease protein [Roseibaca calidilacus]|uniref:Transport permease protein n=2 Tax=Roseibaca calidilacus TaxID=1666912 RepID=A0A0N8K8D0_9RHOB|nr:MAG: ABC-2 type transport system permease protein [Roseibaca calidilacus]CUX81397.1 ABC-2 type transport system permease protein [Roseibaca calidilacus]
MAAEQTNMGMKMDMAGFRDIGARRFGRVNWLGLGALAKREVMRFLVVWTQTLAAPLVTAGLFLAVFTLAIGPMRGEVMGVSFVTFLAPGILMMTIIQNAFANTSSSIVISKVQGNIVDTLMPPLSGGELVLGYMAGGVARGLMVGVVILAAEALVLGQGVAHSVWLLVFVTLGAALLSAIGIAAGILSNKFDQIAAITNFIVVPLSFLSGTFYSISALPPFMAALSRVNPVFYLIDGARYGMIGQSDASPWLGLAVVLAALVAVSALCWHWLRTGYRLKP